MQSVEQMCDFEPIACSLYNCGSALTAGKVHFLANSREKAIENSKDQ